MIPANPNEWKCHKEAFPRDLRSTLVCLTFQRCPKMGRKRRRSSEFVSTLPTLSLSLLTGSNWWPAIQNPPCTAKSPRHIGRARWWPCPAAYLCTADGCWRGCPMTWNNLLLPISPLIPTPKKRERAALNIENAWKEARHATALTPSLTHQWNWVKYALWKGFDKVRWLWWMCAES